jgi:hypothetical protein
VQLLYSSFSYNTWYTSTSVGVKYFEFVFPVR